MVRIHPGPPAYRRRLCGNRHWCDSCDFPVFGIGALAQLGERLLCKHQVIGSIPIGSTKSQEERRTSEARVALFQDRPALRSAPIRRGFAATDGLAGETRYPHNLEMKRNGSAFVRKLEATASVFDIVNGFLKSMPLTASVWERRLRGLASWLDRSDSRPDY